MVIKKQPLPTDTDDRLLSVSEACKLLGLSRPTVYGMIQRRELPAVRIGNVFRIPRRALTEFVTQAINICNPLKGKQL